MLPGFSGGTGQLVLIDRIDISERAADLTEDLSWGEGMCPGIGVLQQWWEGLAGVGMLCTWCAIGAVPRLHALQQSP